MIAQTFKLSLKPDDHPPRVPVVFANQYDEGRPFSAEIYDVDGSAYTFTDETVTVQGTKPSGTGFSIPATYSGNTVTFSTTGQMTVVHGFVRCGIIITKGDVVVGSLAFMLYVQKAPLGAGTIIDASDFNSIIVSALAAKGLLVTDTASGSLASFPDGANGMPVVSITTDNAATEIYRAGKNILPFPYRDSSATSSGVTRTVNDDGTISLSGTATAAFSFVYTANFMDVINPNVGDVLVFTDGLEYAANRYSRLLWADTSGGIGTVNGSYSLTVTQEHLDRGVYFGLRIVNGANCDGIVVKPMVRIYGDDTYEPYAVETFAVGDDVTTVKGPNSIWADTGDVTVEYVADTKAYIDKQIAEVQALVLES